VSGLLLIKSGKGFLPFRKVDTHVKTYRSFIPIYLNPKY
jgi:hypothetical protein